MSDIEWFIENWGALAERHWHAMPSEALERLGIRSFSNFGVCIYAHFIFMQILYFYFLFMETDFVASHLFPFDTTKLAL